MITFVVTCTPDYPRAWIFSGLSRLIPDVRVACLLDPSDQRTLPAGCGRIPYRSNDCRHQAGGFLQAMPGMFREHDLIILADCDAVVQRDFTRDELYTLSHLDERVWLGYNTQPGQRGLDEFARLHPKVPPKEAAKALEIPLDVLEGCWIYNTGLMAAEYCTWNKIRSLFQSVSGKGAHLFGMHSWPQYLICCLLYQNGIEVQEMGYETHSHGHCPLTQDHVVKDGRLYYRDQLVFFAHNLRGIAP